MSFLVETDMHRRRRSQNLGVAICLVLFIGLVVFLAVGLKRDPREIPSPLVGKPAPHFSLLTLEPGDVLATGTPAGVGMSMQPACYLKEGDVVRIEIEGLGAIENTVVKEKGGTVIT